MAQYCPHQTLLWVDPQPQEGVITPDNVGAQQPTPTADSRGLRPSAVTTSSSQASSTLHTTEYLLQVEHAQEPKQ